jgi:type II secretory pathway pseudopilin PulG
LMSSTLAVTVVAPPVAGTVAGLAFMVMRPTAAVPTAIRSAPVAPVLVAPDDAVITALPFAAPALNFTTARPLISVSASAGWIVPSVVVKRTRVPLCGGVPDGSMIWAMTSAVPFTDNALVAAVRVIVDPEGARSGTFSQATAAKDSKAAAESHGRRARRSRVIMDAPNILADMHLHGQDKARDNRQNKGRAPAPSDGYAMVALLVGMSVMAVLMTAAMPVWKQAAIREKEAELIFRGEQYVRAIELFGRKSGPGVLPPTVDVLVDQRFLRKKFKDPITGEDFQPLIAGQAVPGSAAPGLPVGAPPGGPAPSPAGRGGVVGMAPGARGGLQGVVSKSKAKSLRLYNGRGSYNEWAFIYTPRVQAPAGGADAPGTQPGARGRGRGAPPDNRGGRATQPPQPGRGGRRGFPGVPPPPGRGFPLPPNTPPPGR